jgi:YggT family protein
MIYGILADIVQVYVVVIFVRIVASWIPVDPWSKWARANRVLERATDPMLVPVRRVIPPLRLGGAAIDLSPFVVLVALSILLEVLRSR